MKSQFKSIRTFIGSLNFRESRKFYKDLGWEEIEISTDMMLFKINDNLAFYLQDYYAKDWVNNTMVFVEVDDIDEYWKELSEKGLVEKYKNVRLTEIKSFDWGRECFLHDPSGVLWHFGVFN